MRMLMFMARRFWWRSFSKTLQSAEEIEVDETVEDAVVAFLQVEARDERDRDEVFLKALKNIKWLANKRSLKRVVLHSFAHLGGANADAGFAGALISELADRLRTNGYEAWTTPFGYFNEWELKVYGESLGKVWKEL